MAAVAFFSDDALIKFRKGDTLIVDASDGRIKSGETSAKALVAAVRRKAQVFSLPNLNAKVFVFDRTVAIGSANVSRSSSSSLIEAGLLTDDTATVSQATALVESLRGMATPADSAFLRHIAKLKVRNRGRGAGRKLKKRAVGRIGRRT